MSETQTTEVTPGNEDKFSAVLEKLNETIAGLKQSPAPPPAPAAAPKPEERVFTVAELRQMVEKEEISEDQMLAQLQYQNDKAMDQKIEQRLATERQAMQSNARAESRISEYVQNCPELKQSDSAEYKRYHETFQQLVAEGKDGADPETKLLALRMEFGKPESLKKIPETTRETRRTSETTGTGGSGRTRTETTDGAPDWLPQELRRHFERGIERGLYKGWDDIQTRRELVRHRAKHEDWPDSKLRTELAKLKKGSG